MEDFFYAGGLPGVLGQLLPLLHGGAGTVNGRSLADSDDPSMAIDESSVLVLEHAGPRGADGRTPVHHDDAAGPSHT
jgi:dihydroxyacid dehydratase/phosphogluconate dehydratase